MRSLMTLALTLTVIGCSSKPAASGPTDAVNSAVQAGQTNATTEIKAKESEAVKEVVKDEKELTGVGVTCTKGKDSRTLSVAKPDAGGCEVSYSKFGSAQTVASAKNEGVAYCEGIVTKMKANLEASGFTCQ